jgi:hypothetical protein
LVIAAIDVKSTRNLTGFKVIFLIPQPLWLSPACSRPLVKEQIEIII